MTDARKRRVAIDLSPLRVSPRFRILFLGHFFAQMGAQAAVIVVAWQVKELTGSPAAVGLIGLVELVPLLFLSLFGGALADAADRRKVLLLCDGGQLVVASPLRGTWLEFLDIFREVLVHAGRNDALGALDAYITTLPEADALAEMLEEAGLGQVEIEVEHWDLVFRSAREFFYAPVIEHGPLTQWKEIVGREVLQETFLSVKDAIDTYFSGRAFAVSVFGGRFSARKPA